MTSGGGYNDGLSGKGNCGYGCGKQHVALRIFACGSLSSIYGVDSEVPGWEVTVLQAPGSIIR